MRLRWSIVSAIVVFISCALLLLQFRHRIPIHNASTSSLCNLYPDSGDIAVAIRTGATEGVEKLPAVLSALACVRNVIIFSDLEQTIQGYHLRDLYSNFSPWIIQNNPDFEIYRRQQELKAQNRESEIKSLRTLPAHPRDWRTKGKSAAWQLCAYSNIPMLIALYDLQPDQKWYVFLDTDTYISWPSLKRWLSELDPGQKLYLGNALPKSEDREPKEFGHGGSGYILSSAAVKEFVRNPKGSNNYIDSRADDGWAGDMMLANALYDEIGLQVTNVAPKFGVHGLLEVGFGKERWCQRFIGLHHMDSKSSFKVQRLDEAKDFSGLRYRDVYPLAHPEGFPEVKHDWDNLSEEARFRVRATTEVDPALNPHTRFEACRLACEHSAECMQFMFRNTTTVSDTKGVGARHECVLSSAFRLGHAKASQLATNEDEPGFARSWTSGWMTERIEKWVGDHAECLEDGD